MKAAHLEQSVDGLLATLTPREEKIVRMLFGIGGIKKMHSREEIAEHFHLHRDRVRQILCRARRKIEHPSRKRWRVHFHFEWPDDTSYHPEDVLGLGGNDRCGECGKTRDGHSLARHMHEPGACEQFQGVFVH